MSAGANAEELAAKTEKQIELMKELINSKKSELAAIRERDRNEVIKLTELANTLEREIQEKRSVLAQRMADYESAGRPAIVENTAPKMTVTAICSWPTGAQVNVEYGDTPANAFVGFKNVM